MISATSEAQIQRKWSVSVASPVACEQGGYKREKSCLRETLVRRFHAQTLQIVPGWQRLNHSNSPQKQMQNLSSSFKVITTLSRTESITVTSVGV